MKSFKFDLCIEGIPNCTATAEGLAFRGRQLEEVVAPFVQTRKTGQPVRFKGRKRYLRPDWKSGQAAVEALQLLYQLQEAREEGDVDGATFLAMAFARVNYEALMQQHFGKPNFALTIAGVRAGNGSRKGGRVNRFSDPHSRKLFDEAVAAYGANITEIVLNLNTPRNGSHRPYGRQGVRNELKRRRLL